MQTPAALALFIRAFWFWSTLETGLDQRQDDNDEVEPVPARASELLKPVPEPKKDKVEQRQLTKTNQKKPSKM